MDTISSSKIASIISFKKISNKVLDVDSQRVEKRQEYKKLVACLRNKIKSDTLKMRQMSTFSTVFNKTSSANKTIVDP